MLVGRGVGVIDGVRVAVGVSVFVGVGDGVNVGVGVKVGVGVGVRVALSRLACAKGTASSLPRAKEIVGVLNQANIPKSTTRSTKLQGSRAGLERVRAVGEMFGARVGRLGGGIEGSWRQRPIAQCIPLRANSLWGLISRARSKYARLARGEAQAARNSQGSSRPGARAAACSAQRRAAR